MDAARDVIGRVVVHDARSCQEKDVKLGHPHLLGPRNKTCGKGCETDAFHGLCRRFFLLFGESDQPHLCAGHQLLQGRIDRVCGPVFAVADDLAVLDAFHRVPDGSVHEVGVDVEHRQDGGCQVLGSRSANTWIEFLAIQIVKRGHTRCFGCGNQQHRRAVGIQRHRIGNGVSVELAGSVSGSDQNVSGGKAEIDFIPREAQNIVHAGAGFDHVDGGILHTGLDRLAHRDRDRKVAGRRARGPHRKVLGRNRAAHKKGTQRHCGTDGPPAPDCFAFEHVFLPVVVQNYPHLRVRRAKFRSCRSARAARSVPPLLAAAFAARPE